MARSCSGVPMRRCMRPSWAAATASSLLQEGSEMAIQRGRLPGHPEETFAVGGPGAARAAEGVAGAEDETQTFAGGGGEERPPPRPSPASPGGEDARASSPAADRRYRMPRPIAA